MIPEMILLIQFILWGIVREIACAQHLRDFIVPRSVGEPVSRSVFTAALFCMLVLPLGPTHFVA